MLQSRDRAGEIGFVDDMVWIAGSVFRMGSDHHYPEEAPAHRISVDGFWIDRTPVTNHQFKKFVNATGHVTTAQIVPNPKDYPGALPGMIRAGSLVFVPPRVSDLRDWRQWWTFGLGRSVLSLFIRERRDALSPSAAPAATTSAISTSRKSSAGSEIRRLSLHSRNGRRPGAFGLSDNNGRLKGDPSKDALSDHR